MESKTEEIEKEIKRIIKEREGGIEIELDEAEGEIISLFVDNRFRFNFHIPLNFSLVNPSHNSSTYFTTSEKSNKFNQYIDSLNKFVKIVSITEHFLFINSPFQFSNHISNLWKKN